MEIRLRRFPATVSFPFNSCSASFSRIFSLFFHVIHTLFTLGFINYERIETAEATSLTVFDWVFLSWQFSKRKNLQSTLYKTKKIRISDLKSVIYLLSKSSIKWKRSIVHTLCVFLWIVKHFNDKIWHVIAFFVQGAREIWIECDKQIWPLLKFMIKLTTNAEMTSCQ